MSRQVENIRKVSAEDSKPIYQQLAYIFEEMISKDYQPGDYLPSENELSAKFNVNRHTVRRAMDDLVAAGFVLRKQGKGCLVINNQVEYPFSTGRFTASFDKLGLNATSEILKSDVIACNSKVAEYLNLKEGQDVAVIETLRLVDDKPVSLITHFLNLERLPDIHERYCGGSLHECIETCYQLSLVRTSALIQAVMPDSDEAFYLQSSLTKPLLKVKSFNGIKDNPQQLVEVSISRSRSDRFQIKL